MSTCQLVEHPLDIPDVTFPRELADLVAEGIRRGQDVGTFGFITSDCAQLYRLLHALPPGRFVEWGSGMGLACIMAETLGFEARGIELEPALAEASRQFLTEHGYRCRIDTGNYHDIRIAADYYYVYCWPGQTPEVEQNFLEHTPASATLLFCDGAERIVRKIKRTVEAG